MSVRKREWTTDKGEKLADQFAATANVEVRQGVHVADSASATVKQAGAFWRATSTASGLERSTIDQYRQHVELHINPLLGEQLLSRLTVPLIRQFEDELRTSGRSPAMVKKVLVSLGSLLADAQERGLVVRNAVREKGRARQKGKERRHEKRQKGKLKVGVDHSYPRGRESDCRRSGGPLEAFVAGSDESQSFVACVGWTWTPKRSLSTSGSARIGLTT